MFKCTECGNEYNTKPDYCDCGNDNFEEVLEPQKDNEQGYTKEEKEPVDYIHTGKLQKNENGNIDSIQTIKSETIRPLSWIIFSLCLFMSLVVIFFVWNPKEVVSNIEKTVVDENLNLPSINALWNDSYATNVDKNVKKNTKYQSLNKVTRSKTTVNNTISKFVPQKLSQQTSKNIATQKTSQEAVKPQPLKQTVKPIAQPIAKPVEKKVVSKQVLIDYKIELRNTIGRKIDFTKVVGDGDCIVSFRISKQGVLIDRSFSKQSSNMTLNDAVYYAIMSTPNFKNPPENYNNELLNLSVKFYSGNFEIDLK